MKYGRPLLYILVWLLLSSFLNNSIIGTIQLMVESFNEPLNNLVHWLDDMFVSDFIITAYDTLFWNRGDELLALIIVLIFYLGVDKKVWKR